MSDRSRIDEVKNIGDAGDSIPTSLDAQSTDNPVCEMVKCIKAALHCGDHQSLKVALEKLETWKDQKENEHLHNYWKVAQLTGEVELRNICILLTVTSEKPENVRWQYLQDALSVLATCLCNREIIHTMLFYANDVQPILDMALVQSCNEKVCFNSLLIINKMLIVCRERFAKFILTHHFREALLEGVEHWFGTSERMTNMILQIIKSVLMCGQDNTFDLATQIIKSLAEAFNPLNEEKTQPSDKNHPRNVLENHELFKELRKSIDFDYSSHECAIYWTNGKSIKQLLHEALEQPWLFIHCSLPSCDVHNGMPQTFFRKCGACSLVRYCSRQCQTEHWNADHHSQCKAIVNKNKSA